MSGTAAEAPARGSVANDDRETYSRSRAASARLAGPIGISALLHVVAIAALVLRRGAAPTAEPPAYRVELVAAPPGARAIGEVAAAPAAESSPVETPAPVAPAPPPPRPESRPSAMRAPTPRATKPPPPRATPVPPTNAKPAAPKMTPKAPAKAVVRPTPKPPTPRPADARPATGPRAAGGPEGDRGADVATVKVAGLDFPYPGYLRNVVQQVALRFTPPSSARLLQADVSFLIHRDGSVSDVRVVRRSGNYAFDLEAQGAVESVGSTRAFGTLPQGFNGDVLPVTFSFDPRVIH